LSTLFSFTHVYAYDIDPERAGGFACELSTETGLQVEAVEELPRAVALSDIVVTCTPANGFFLKQEWVRPGTFVAAVGADSKHKQELEPALLSTNKTVVDILDQAASIGDLHHSIDAGLMTKNDVFAELGQVVCGNEPGRASNDEIIIFDSTGMALQDVIVAAAVYETAASKNLGALVDLNGNDPRSHTNETQSHLRTRR
jgi:ornithine cyclodeaminase/alanine dehydrogenase